MLRPFLKFAVEWRQRLTLFITSRIHTTQLSGVFQGRLVSMCGNSIPLESGQTLFDYLKTKLTAVTVRWICENAGYAVTA